MELIDKVRDIAKINPFNEAAEMINTKLGFIGVPIDLDFEYVKIMVNDFYKEATRGLPKGCFLICVRPKIPVEEFILLRVLEPINLPSADALLASKVEYFKEFTPAGETDFTDKIDPYTKSEFQYSGVKCRVLGTFYTDINSGSQTTRFGADVENFYSSHNYLIYKPFGNLLAYIVNFCDSSSLMGGTDSSRIGMLRYSSTRKKEWSEEIPIYIRTRDLLKNRTALFGMTRTGKSNTVKKIIDATVQLSIQENRKIGQLIFDINGEYANKNRQDDGTAISEKYQNDVKRYSLIDKRGDGFLQMRANFYHNPEFAFQMILPFISEDSGDYVRSFKSIDLTEPEPTDYSRKYRYERVVAALKCCLYRAQFKDNNEKVKFSVNKEILDELEKNFGYKRYDFSNGVSLQQATDFFELLWEKYDELQSLIDYKLTHDKEWADEDLKSLLTVLTRSRQGSSSKTLSGYIKIRRKELYDLHTETTNDLFEDDIVQFLRDGKIVIVDLSEGPEITRTLYSKKIVQRIFDDSTKLFIENKDENSGFNVIQIYFEEAHNLFPKKENSDLSDIYNRLAKEGSKYNLGINYATQEVSSISSNILKNTQNWFIAHLNNTDEIREINKFYDFKDFEDSILKVKDKGFLRMKTYSNDYVIPVQIDKFISEK